MIRLAGILLLATLLAGCASSGSWLYMEPYGLDDLTCTELTKRADRAAKRASETDELRARAARDPGGSIIGAIAYAPDNRKARWEVEHYQAAIARKNCPTEAPKS